MESAKKNLKINPRESANILSVLFFWWLNPFFRLGYKKDLDVHDLYSVVKEDCSQELGEKLQREWEKELARAKTLSGSANNKKGYQPSLLKALCRSFGPEFMLFGILVLIEECFLRIGQPLCLGRLLRYFTAQSDMKDWEAYLYALGVVMGSAIYTFTHHPYFFGVQHSGMKLRVASCSLVYRKCLKLSKTAMAQTTIGQMVNLLSNDVNRFDQSVLFLHYLWVGPIQTIIILFILWSELGPSCLAGLLILLLFVPFQGWLGKVFSRLRLETAQRTDERIRVMSELISGMRVIKMYTWENPFAKLIDKLRRKEVNVIRKSAYYRSLNMSLFFTSSKIIVFLTFLAYVLTGNLLTAEKVFVTVTLYNNIRLIMTLFFPFGITQAAETGVSIKRLQTFLLLDEKEKNTEAHAPRPPTEECGISLDHVIAKWSTQAEDSSLKDITFQVRPGQLLAVIGPVGSGKSTLLHSILHELLIESGSVKVVGKLAYASQEPWVFSGTVQQNILCGKPYHSHRYKRVIQVCALESDLTLLPHGDQTFVGERGVSLSGGQRARVNLARALYVDADVYLLDDPLSAVDTHVGRHLFDQSINGFLKKKIRVLVTHQLQYLKEADQILILKDGRMEAIGKFDELLKSGVDFAKLLSCDETEEEELEKDLVRSLSVSESDLEHSISRCNSLSNGSVRRRLGSSISRSSIKSSKEEENTKVKPVSNEEMRSTGTVSSKIYWEYFHAGCNVFVMFLMVILNLLTQVLYSGSDYWLSIWCNAEEKRGIFELSQKLNKSVESSDSFNDTASNGDLVDETFTVFNLTASNEKTSWADSLDTYSHVYIYSAIVLAVFILSMIRTVVFFVVCMKSSVNLHNRMFSSVIRAPIRFFDINPVGRTLNRFAKDVGSMDEVLPVAFFDVVTIFLTQTGIIFIVGVVNPWLVLPCVFLGAIFHYLRKFYLETARDVKRIEGITRSPVFSHLSSSLIGLTTVRAHGAEEIFQAKFDDLQDVHSAAWYMFLATTRWFGIWLDWICVFYVACVTFTCVALHQSTSSSNAGLVISSAMMLTGAFQWGVRQSAEVENQMTSVERVLEYSKLPSEPPLESSPDKKPPSDWPTKGQIRFERVFLRYAETEAPVLKEIRCTINPQEKIGIVGRTGAGKSSLIAALFRLTEPEGNIYIDDVETKSLGLHDLRSRLAIIPQDPVLFSGSLRRNLDPFSDYNDEALWGALEEVELKEVVSDLAAGLETEMAEGGSNFSVGQRQLVCLARAILRQNKILVLDEATANVDPRTDELIQKTIRHKFSQCTVLTIAHRLNTIMDSDRIMVLDAGYLKEFDEPAVLLENPCSLFYSLVEQTGKGSAEILIEMARQAALARRNVSAPEDPSATATDSSDN